MPVILFFFPMYAYDLLKQWDILKKLGGNVTIPIHKVTVTCPWPESMTGSKRACQKGRIHWIHRLTHLRTGNPRYDALCCSTDASDLWRDVWKLGISSDCVRMDDWVLQYGEAGGLGSWTLQGKWWINDVRRAFTLVTCFCMPKPAATKRLTSLATDNPTVVFLLAPGSTLQCFGSASTCPSLDHLHRLSSFTSCSTFCSVK